MDPTTGIRKLNVTAGPVGLALGPLDIARDGADYDDGDLRTQSAENFGEMQLACAADFSAGFRRQAIDRALAQVNQIAAEIAKRFQEVALAQIGKCFQERFASCAIESGICLVEKPA